MLTYDELKAASQAKYIGSCWGKLTTPGPAMIIAQMRGASFDSVGGWARPISSESRKQLHQAADELAAALGYKNEEALAEAEYKTPDNVWHRMQERLKHFTGADVCPTCRRAL